MLNGNIRKLYNLGPHWKLRKTENYVSAVLHQLPTYSNWEVILHPVLAEETFRRSNCYSSNTEVCADDLSVLGTRTWQSHRPSGSQQEDNLSM